jgi:hypothetical protein
VTSPIRYRWLEADEFDPRRRVRVVTHHGFEGYIVRWTESCSGCRYPDGSNDGCRECGHTGKRRVSMFRPFDERAFQAWCDQRWARRERLLAFWRRKAVA